MILNRSYCDLSVSDILCFKTKKSWLCLTRLNVTMKAVDNLLNTLKNSIRKYSDYTEFNLFLYCNFVSTPFFLQLELDFSNLRY